MTSRRAVFLDKDGTLVVDVPFNVDPERIALAPGTGPGLKRLAEAGYRLIVVSNQSGVARGYFAERQLQDVFHKLGDLLAPFGVQLDGFYYCPHHPQGSVAEFSRECDCRKPLPGLLLKAAREHDINLKHSWMIGDTLDDIQAGRRAGCRGVLIDNGNETLWEITPERTPEYKAADMDDAAQWILRSGRKADAASSSNREQESEEHRACKSC